MIEFPEFGFLLSQLRSGLTTAMIMFLIASGLSLIFGVLKIINFAHGSMYMIGAYVAWNMTLKLGNSFLGFWGAVLIAASAVALLGYVVERCLLQFMYKREELYQLLFTYALVLILSDGCKFIWGTEPHSVSRPEALNGHFDIMGVRMPHYDLVIVVIGVLIAVGFWLLLNRTSWGRIIRAAAMDREMLGALGTNVQGLYTSMFVLASFLAGLSGALVTPMKSVVPGMDVEIIIEVFIVVVIGGLGSLWGTLLGSIVYGLIISFGILIMPKFSTFAAPAMMVLVLIVRPWGLMGRPVR